MFKKFTPILHRYINFPYLLRQCLLILTTFFTLYPIFFNISQRNFLLRPNGGVLTPKTHLAYASGCRVFNHRSGKQPHWIYLQ